MGPLRIVLGTDVRAARCPLPGVIGEAAPEGPAAPGLLQSHPSLKQVSKLASVSQQRRVGRHADERVEGKAVCVAEHFAVFVKRYYTQYSTTHKEEWKWLFGTEVVALSVRSSGEDACRVAALVVLSLPQSPPL